MAHHQPCRFYQSPNGCRNGKNCQFAHTNSTSLDPMGSPGSSMSWRKISHTQIANSTLQVPPGICRYYWTSGKCNREFQCRFQHERSDAGHEARLSFSPRRSSGSFMSVAAKEMAAPFLTENGLAKINSKATDNFFAPNDFSSLSPTDVHRQLKRFIEEDFKFKTSFNIYAFLGPLSSANPTNPLWTQEEGQLLLTTLSSANGCLRIADIINWPDISLNAGQNRDVLSFQRGILPLLRYLSSEYVIKSTLITQANRLYTVVLHNLARFADVIECCLDQGIKSQSFGDPTTLLRGPIDVQVFVSVAGVLHEFLVRFKNAVASYPRLAQLVKSLSQTFQDWHSAITTRPEAFGNSLNDFQPAARELLLGSIKEKVHKLISILDREEGKLLDSDEKKERKTFSSTAEPQDALIAALHMSYEGPGYLREKGPRHGNDFEDIYKIRIAPTNTELLCRLPPFLPANIFGAPHPAPPSSMQRLLDIQFRLLREELTAPLRMAIQLVHDDLENSQINRTKLWQLMQKQGGKYRGLVETQDSLMFNVYTGVQFRSLVPDRKGISARLVVDTPPGRARSSRQARVAYWESMGGKRLSQGGLISLVWKSGRRTTVHLGIISSSSKDLTEYVKSSTDDIELRIVFFDADVELRILQELRSNQTQKSYSDTKMLVESPVMFETIRPFLEALQTEPEDVPFSRYLVHQSPSQLSTIAIQPPQYARVPDFKFQLSSLFDAEDGIDDLTLSVTDRDSIQHARTQLREKSRLDPSQADAVVDTLTREVALIQGPPGTGKSFTGVEILRVLQANKVGPILMIAFTNHALDHMLCSVLDANITDKIVRLGRRTADERIAKYSVETLEMTQNYSRLGRSLNVRRELKAIQEAITNVMGKILKVDLENDSAEIMKYISAFCPEHHDYLLNAPEWVSKVRTYMGDDEEDAGESWQRAGPKGKSRAYDNSNYAFWKECRDLAFIDQVINGPEHPKLTPNSRIGPHQNVFDMLTVEDAESDQEPEPNFDFDDSDDALDVEEGWKDEQFGSIPTELDDFSDNPLTPSSSAHSSMSEIDCEDVLLQPDDFLDLDAFFVSLGFKQAPSVPFTNRPLEELLENVGDLWNMSQSERQRIHTYWVEEARSEIRVSSMREFERLRELHTQKLNESNETNAEIRRGLLEEIDIIGCTTTGAAQLTTLLRGLSPKVLLVEEAGQVMEAHILGTLVPSIEHLILIGDPLQLRPTLNNYSLSMDNRRGRVLFKFDMSLMERLSTSGLPMSRIDVQRRMRPAISSLIRNALYPRLEDHEIVRKYPDVRGIQKNLFFVTHQHRENDGGDDTASKYNTYEVAMISDLVLYLLRQGCYTNEGDIVVLCAYLGQLARLRDALRNEVAVIIDERDQASLDDQESDEDEKNTGEVKIERVNVTKKVRLRTVDNYQGEEGRIIILSLVRNAGGLEDDQPFANRMKPSIGFLKSENRTNVALSRAREGLFIFGNADNLSSRSKMWSSIIEELYGIDCVGPALPIVCHRHPDRVEYVSKPGILPQISPDGGCLKPCEIRLKCGHNCPFKCHCDDPNHLAIVCTQPCRRLCARGNHPCKKLCTAACGPCHFSIENVELPCGHTKSSVGCFRFDNLDTVYCDFEMEKPLSTCEHSAVMACGQDVSVYKCVERCGSTMKCCSKTCNASCHECQSKNNAQADEKITRTEHRTHPCRESLHCGHRCQEHCSEGHTHTVRCTRTCRQSCVHAQCQRPCSMLCAPCQEPCAWVCPHYLCPVPCGSICVRLPCDLPCTNLLACGHRCPSVCGEDCSHQVCPECAPATRKSDIVDLILSRTLSDVLPELGGLDDLVITNPSCGHLFTVETLDGLTAINDFYSRDRQDTKWTGLKAPLGVVKLPVCPNCRAPLTCKRYGRIVKRANLDILERNVASHMSRSLDRWHSSIRGFNENIPAAAAPTMQLSGSEQPPRRQKLDKARKTVLGNTEEKPMSDADIRADNKKLHYIHSAVTDAWQKATGPLFESYREIVRIADTRSAHTQAWEAAFSFLYEREIEAGLKEPLKMPKHPEQHAMRMAGLQVGQPRPLADRRFLVEAFWGSIHIRLILIRLAQIWLDKLTAKQFHTQQWATYIDFLLKTCSVDAEKAIQVAEDSNSHRQIIKSVLYWLRIELEAFRFNLHMCKKFGAFKNSDTRKSLHKKASEIRKSCKQTVEGSIKKYLQHTRSSPQDPEWLEENFTTAALAIIDEWAKIEVSVLFDTFYQPVSLEEKMDIIRAFSFVTTGHFYTCPNGHIYTITECGGAMERSRCPECGEDIGGENHRLVGTNRIANELDELARTANPNVGRGYWADPY